VHRENVAILAASSPSEAHLSFASCALSSETGEPSSVISSLSALLIINYMDTYSLTDPEGMEG